MKLIEEDKRVCVEIEKYHPNLSQYMFVTLKGKLNIVTNPSERAEVIEKMRQFGKERLSRNFLAAHGLQADENWEALTEQKPIVIVKLDPIAAESGLRSP